MTTIPPTSHQISHHIPFHQTPPSFLWSFRPTLWNIYVKKSNCSSSWLALHTNHQELDLIRFDPIRFNFEFPSLSFCFRPWESSQLAPLDSLEQSPPDQPPCNHSYNHDGQNTCVPNRTCLRNDTWIPSDQPFCYIRSIGWPFFVSAYFLRYQIRLF